MKKGWLIFTGLMSVASVTIIANYTFSEIRGVSVEWKYWAMILIGGFLWIRMFVQAFKKDSNG